MNITVIGTGYAGLVTGACFAETGNQVVCVDIDEDKVRRMQAGKVPIYEPDLEEIFERNVAAKRLSFTTSLEEGVENADVVFLALPTPPSADGSANLSYVLGVADELGHVLKKYTVIVDKSTVPVGTAARVRDHIAHSAQVEFDVASNPEFLREGLAVEDFMRPDRIIIGTDSKPAQEVLERLYAPFVNQGSQLLHMDPRSAEMTKYAANSFLALKISFMNEIANLSESMGVNIDDVRRGMGTDTRIGPGFLQAGIGYGGSCFPKDVLALKHMASEQKYDFKILDAVIEVNEGQQQRLVKKISEYFGGQLEGKKLAFWGLAFKPDTDDIRESRAIEVAQSLLGAGAHIVAYDPQAMAATLAAYPDLKAMSYAESAYASLEGADALVIATEWPEFGTPDFDKMKQLLKTPVIFDGRNMYDIKQVKNNGFHYESIGRETIG